MANNDILQYLRETPHNTNVNVVKGMIGNESGGGAIEMETVFEDDISLEFTPASMYSNASASYSSNGLILKSGGYKISFDNFISYSGAHTNNYLSNSVSSTPFGIVVSNNDNGNTLKVEVNSWNTDTDSDLETYCQTPHHLKIEWFTI